MCAMPRSSLTLIRFLMMFISTVVGIFILVNSHVLADSKSSLSHESLVELLREGGYSLYFRHEATDWSQTDHIEKAGDWLSCDGNRIRQLSAQGRQRAMATGNAIRSLGIPIGRVLASPYCRTMETARLMNPGEVESSTDVVNLRVAEFFGGRSAIIETAKALLATPPEKDTNTLIVAHGNVARNATPVYPEEGEAVVFQADDNGGFRFVGRLTAEDWDSLGSANQ